MRQEQLEDLCTPPMGMLAIQAWPAYSETENSLHKSLGLVIIHQCNRSATHPLCSLSCQHLHSECLELSLCADSPELCRPLQQLPPQSFRL